MPADMFEHFRDNVPLGPFKCLTYYSFLLSAMWTLSEKGDQAGLKALLARALVFSEQVAVEGGQHYQLAWLLTGLEEPPFHVTEQHKQVRRTGAHAQLADPRWVTANLAYLRDIDLMQERTAKSHFVPKPKGKGKGDKEE